MTLLTTEIYPGSDPPYPFIIFAADRRISRGGAYDDTRPKIFRIPALNAGIGYFGLAEVPGRAQAESMAEWLERFIGTSRTPETLESFAGRLATSLNSAVPVYVRRTAISGFHISGFTSGGVPEFWFVRNVEDDRQTIFGEYRTREDFQRAHAGTLPPDGYQIYRNGDIRAHVVAWQEMDRSLGALRIAPDFRPLVTPDDYASWLAFKMEVVAMLYERYCTRSIIGGPVNAFAISGQHK